MIDKIRIEDFTYNLPDERIAKFPLANRDDSKLLVRTKATGYLPTEQKFTNIVDFLPKNGFMVFNNTKVVPARLFFRRETGAHIEIFCLEPHEPVDYALSFAQTERCSWKVIVGNVKRWKSDILSFDHQGDEALSAIDLKARLISREGNSAIVEFTWKGGEAFSKVMERCGKIPIPPYLNRETQDIDYERYQTYYAKLAGSVAAPTAGLHFTEKELNQIDAAGIERAELCLHVGAGTFLPVKSEYIEDHTMHSEPFSVSIDFIRRLRAACGNRPVVSVGTTSTRCLESLYYIGVHCIEKGAPDVVRQWEPYREEGYSYTLAQSLDAILSYLENNNIVTLVSRTQIIIVPGFRYRVIDFLVTNFHQPESTLLLLVSAFIGDGWREMYRFALENGFRFLSYGDSSLLERSGR